MSISLAYRLTEAEIKTYISTITGNVSERDTLSVGTDACRNRALGDPGDDSRVRSCVLRRSIGLLLHSSIGPRDRKVILKIVRELWSDEMYVSQYDLQDDHRH